VAGYTEAMQRHFTRKLFFRLAIILAVFAFFQRDALAGMVVNTWKGYRLNSGLVGYLTFDGKDLIGTTAYDRSGQGNNGTLMNGPLPTMGRVGQGLSFDGGTTGNDKVSMGSMTLGSIHTLSVWVYLHGDTMGTYTNLMLQDSPYHQFYLQKTNRFLSYYSNTTGTVSPGVAISIGQWTHCAVVSNGSTLTFYVNGDAVGAPIAGNPGSVTGGWDIGGWSGHTVNGKLDEVRIYDRALTANEVKSLYIAGVPGKVNVTPQGVTNGLVGHWTFDGKDMNWNANTVRDASGNNNTGNLVNMSTSTSPAIGKFGQGMRFDGADDYVFGLLDGTTLTQLSLSFWVNPRTNPAVQTGIFQWAQMVSSDYPFILFTKQPDGSSRLYVDGEYRATTALPAANWSHVFITLDLSNIWHLYVNGVLAGTYQDDATHANQNNAISVYVGNGFQGYFPGIIDDVRIYNRVLSPQEIAQLYTEGGGVKVGVTFLCGVDRVRDADGNLYNTVKIGSQCWMKQNMRVGTMVSGGVNQTNNSTIEKYCYNNDLANCMTSNNPNYPDGGLYQWNEAMQYSTTPGSRGICPLGWHIPTHDEFTTLERAVCTSGTCATDFPYDTTTTGWRGTDEGARLKAAGTSGFEGNLTGYYYGTFESRGTYVFLWSSTEYNGTSVWTRDLLVSSSAVNRTAHEKTGGFSVRCLKD
jgi:uncharacterized protein (TIGR02145 family)